MRCRDPRQTGKRLDTQWSALSAPAAKLTVCPVR
jgi:subtilase family serine protease